MCKNIHLQVLFSGSIKVEKMCKNVHLQVLYGSSTNFHATDGHFCLNMNSLGCSHVGSLFSSEEEKETGSWHSILYTFLWHTPSFFRTSQTARHKMTGLMAGFFWWLSNIDFFNKPDPQLIEKLLQCFFFSLSLLSILVWHFLHGIPFNSWH